MLHCCIQQFFRKRMAHARLLRFPETRREALDWVFWTAEALQGQAEEGEVTWGRLCVGIRRYFERKVPGARERPLESRDLHMFASAATIWQEDGPPVVQAERIGVPVSELLLSRQKLETFWCWFWQAVTTLCVTSAWSAGDQRQRVGRALGFSGFMRRDEALGRLQGKRPGTFLIRFSTTRPGSLAVHYTSTSRRRLGEVVSVLVKVSMAGELTVKNGRRPYDNLDDLVLSHHQLKFVYPDVPKVDVFLLWRRERPGRPAATSTSISIICEAVASAAVVGACW